MRIDHFQLAIPAGSEDICRPFWHAAGFVEVEKPVALQGRGGLWFAWQSAAVHLGVDPAFTPATKAHPGFAVSNPDCRAKALDATDHTIDWDSAIAGRERFFTKDPVGNRIEFLED